MFHNERELNEFMSYLPSDARMLDIGCGAGIPVLKTMVEAG